MLTFKTRARIHENHTARRWIWESHCGRYRVVRSVSLYEYSPNGRPRTTFRAERFSIVDELACWEGISAHRNRHTAERACSNYENHRSSRVTGRVVPAVRPAARRRRGGQPAGAD